VYGPEVDEVEAVELGECGGGAADGIIWGVSVSESASDDISGKDMMVSVSMKVTRLRELDDEEEGEDDMQKCKGRWNNFAERTVWTTIRART
jgi:hypothetical protein